MRALPAVVAGLLGCLLLAGCSGSDDEPSADPSSTSAAPTPTPTAAADVRPPRDGVCYLLDYDEAVAPTAAAEPRQCRRAHTAETFAVGTVDALVDGHLLAIDSTIVQRRVAEACPDRLRSHVGGSLDDVRLSMLQAVWFTPTVEEADTGADWYRCDVVAVAGQERLTQVKGSLKGALAGPDAERYAMCGTAAPDDAGFERVACAERHTWRAIEVVPLGDLAGRKGGYPGQKAVTDAGQTPCEDAGAAVAADPLDYEWAYEAPDKAQWDSGQTFGRCWAPDGG